MTIHPDSGLESQDKAGVANPLGVVLGVRGSRARVSLPAPALSDDLRATVGKFLAVHTGAQEIVGMITEVEAARGEPKSGAVASIDLMGEIRRDAENGDRFRRGVASYPAIGDHVAMIGREDLRLIYKATTDEAVEIGVLYHDNSIPAVVDVNNLLTKHFAVLGSTGVGKSSGVAVIIDAILNAKPALRVFLLDVHNEFGRCFGERANVVTAGNLKLPFWMFNFEEFADVLYGGRPGVEAELDILAEHIPTAKGLYLLHRLTVDRSLIRRTEPRNTGFTVDTPVPYLLQDLVALIDERMGKLENRGQRMHYHRLLARIEAVRSDARYAFMFENANVGGDTMADILALLFRLNPDGPSMTVMQVAGLPVEVVDSVVCVMCRLAFDFGFWSEGVSPLLFVCEEAHRFAAADRAIGFGPARRALLRIAKEGRKYGVHLGIVTQRPAELDLDADVPMQHLVRDADGQRPRPGVAGLGGDRRRRRPLGIRALARHTRSRRFRRGPAAARPAHLQARCRPSACRAANPSITPRSAKRCSGRRAS